LVLQPEWPASAVTLERLSVPTRCTPEDGLSTVKVTGEEEPGNRFELIVACSVTAELEPTLALPVPDPLDVKYAKAAPATARAQAQLSATNALFLVIQRIFFPLYLNSWTNVVCVGMRGHRLEVGAPLELLWQSAFTFLYKAYKGPTGSCSLDETPIPPSRCVQLTRYTF
jgi:hypothetical protein